MINHYSNYSKTKAKLNLPFPHVMSPSAGFPPNSWPGFCSSGFLPFSLFPSSPFSIIFTWSVSCPYFFPSIYYLFVFATVGIFTFWYMREQKLGRQLSDCSCFAWEISDSPKKVILAVMTSGSPCVLCVLRSDTCSLSTRRSLSEPLMTYDLHKDLMCAASKKCFWNKTSQFVFGFSLLFSVRVRLFHTFPTVASLHVTLEDLCG